MSERILPSIEEGLPLVTRARMLCTLAGPGEGRRLRAVQVKLTEALKEIAAHLLSKIGLDHEIGPGQRPACPETAIEHHAAQKRMSAKRQ